MSLLDGCNSDFEEMKEKLIHVREGKGIIKKKQNNTSLIEKLRLYNNNKNINDLK